MISQSFSSNGTKKDINKCVDFKVKDSKLTNVGSKLDHGNKNFSSPEIAKDVKPKAEGKWKRWAHLLAQREKMKEHKKEKYNKFGDSSEKCVLEKWKRIQFSQDYSSNKIIKEPSNLEEGRSVSKSQQKSCDTLQKLVGGSVFSVDSTKSKTKLENKECLEGCRVSLNLTRHPRERLFSDSTCKQTVHESKGKYHREHHESNDSSSSANLTQSFEAPCSSVSLESIQDTDQEVTQILICLKIFNEIMSNSSSFN
ncbi:transcriptional protein SWT1-like [Equus caballus]|uniref:transcriptional protein SWT1-like n=1 Tax=Equus caballus TaxID=9796 RepID=UPI0038B2BBB0